MWRSRSAWDELPDLCRSSGWKCRCLQSVWRTFSSSAARRKLLCQSELSSCWWFFLACIHRSPHGCPASHSSSRTDTAWWSFRRRCEHSCSDTSLDSSRTESIVRSRCCSASFGEKERDLGSPRLAIQNFERLEITCICRINLKCSDRRRTFGRIFGMMEAKRLISSFDVWRYLSF